jgi:hypothetical protein
LALGKKPLMIWIQKQLQYKLEEINGDHLCIVNLFNWVISVLEQEFKINLKRNSNSVQILSRERSKNHTRQVKG